MTASLKRRIVQYSVAVLTSGAALLVRLGLTGAIGPGLPTYLFFYPAVMLSATLYGLGPGLLATAVSALFAVYFILPPDGFAVGSAVDLLGLVIFAWMGTGISLVAAWYHRARDRAARSTTALAGPAVEDSAPIREPQGRSGAPGIGSRPTSLRRWLTFLVLGTAVPLLAFAVVVLVWLVGGYRTDQDRRQADTTRALALAVDAEIRSWKTALQALADSNDLQPDLLAAFYQEAHAVAARHEGWIVLTDASGQQRLNTRRAFGDILPKTGTSDVIQAVFRTRQPVVTDLVFGAVAQRYIVAVVVPVIRDGHVLYSLDMAFGPERLVRLLADQRFPATWIAGITDGQQRVVARMPDLPGRLGQPALPPIARAFATRESGTIETALTDGRVGRNAFQRLREASWTVNVVVPVTELQVAWQRPVLAFLLLGSLAAFGAVGLAVGLAREIARPVTEAANLAAAVVQGQTPALVPSGIAEVAVLQDALAEGAAIVRTATHAREQALTALRQANEGLEARVTERTRALAEANAELHQEIEQRRRAEAALKQLAAELEERVQERTAELSTAIATLKQQAAQLHTVTGELALAEQRERRRLAGVLHDGLQQLLVATRLRAHMLGRSPDAAVQTSAHELVALLEEALAQTRTLTEELSPPTLQMGGVFPALEWLARWTGEKHHLTVRLQPPATPLPTLPEDLSVLLYQAVRELLLNVVKYAQVSEAEVTLIQEHDALTCTVADAGIGFDPTRLRVVGGTEGGFGLLGIRERLELLGGRLEIASAPGQGSRFTLTVPLHSSV